MKRTTVRDVPRPSSPPTAPSLLRGWLAQVVRTSMRRSKAESMEKTPTNKPEGGRSSRLDGGKEGIIWPGSRSGYIEYRAPG